MGSKQKSTKSTQPKKNYLPFIIIGGVLAVALGAGTVLFRSAKQPPQPIPTSTEKAADKASTSPLSGATPPHAKGAATAPVTLEEFGDFECPPCGLFHPQLKKLEAEYGEDKLRVVFRQFPLTNMHKHALVAAYAAEAAGFQGRFWEMYDKLYTNQATWSKETDARPSFLNYAREIGLNESRFVSDMTSREADARVMFDYQRGRALGVTGTPTIFSNGRMLPPTATENDMRDMINAGLGGKAQ
jgi:protein-disulfide isomerase